MVDIIIPAYNCNKTLPKLLASVELQTNKKDYLVTVIDDCSREDMTPIINDFKRRINLQYFRLEKNLKYPGLVRQEGILRTSAPYIMFVDSDDYLAPKAVDVANTVMTNTDADVVIGYFYRETKHGKWDIMKENSSTWLHGNIYRRDFLEKNEISFPSGYNEDGAFNTQCYMLTDKIRTVNIPIYYWTNTEGSITREKGKFSQRHANHFIDTLTHAYSNILKHSNNYEKIYSNMGTHIAFSYKLLNDILKLKKEDEEFEQAEKELITSLHNFVNHFELLKENENLSFFKKGFLKGYTKYIVENPIIQVNDFFKEFGIKITLIFEDLK